MRLAVILRANVLFAVAAFISIAATSQAQPVQECVPLTRVPENSRGAAQRSADSIIRYSAELQTPRLDSKFDAQKWLVFAEARLLTQWVEVNDSVRLGVFERSRPDPSFPRWCLGGSGSSLFVLSRVSEGAPRLAGLLALAGPHVLHASHDSVVFGGEAASLQEQQVSLRQLRTLSKMLGSQPTRPTILLFFSDTGALGAKFPLQFRDGRSGDYSFTIQGGPALAMIASQESRFSPHELVHIVLQLRKSKALQAGLQMPYTLTEALAVALGGSSGKELSTLVAQLAVVAPENITPFGALDSQTLQDLPWGDQRLRYQLGSLFRVILRKCGRLPLGFLEVSSRSSLGDLFKLAIETTGLSAELLNERLLNEARESEASLWAALSKPIDAECVSSQ